MTSDTGIPPEPAEKAGEPRIDPMQDPKRPGYFMNYAEDETPAEMVLRKLACWLGVGGYNAPKVDAEVFHDKIIWGVQHLLSVAEKTAEKAGEQRALRAALRIGTLLAFKDAADFIPEMRERIEVVIAALASEAPAEAPDDDGVVYPPVVKRVRRAPAEAGSAPLVLPEPDIEHAGQGEVCLWHEDDDGLWQMGCGGDPWLFEDGGVVENRVKFCLHCGKPVRPTDQGATPLSPKQESGK